MDPRASLFGPDFTDPAITVDQGHLSGMIVRILAARFGDETAAQKVVALLRRRLDLGATDLSVAPLGGVDQPPGPASLLAGRFVDPRVSEVREIIRQAGGEIVADLDEGWTRPRAQGERSGARWNGLPSVGSARGRTS